MTSGSASSPSARPQLAQPLDGSAERELRASEPLDEVAAAAEPERLERSQLAVDGSVAAGDPLCADAVARDDALPLEQQLGQRPAVGTCPGTVPGRVRKGAAPATSGPGSR